MIHPPFSKLACWYLAQKSWHRLQSSIIEGCKQSSIHNLTKISKLPTGDTVLQHVHVSLLSQHLPSKAMPRKRNRTYCALDCTSSILLCFRLHNQTPPKHARRPSRRYPLRERATPLRRSVRIPQLQHYHSRRTPSPTPGTASRFSSQCA